MNKKSMLLCSLLLAMPALAGCGSGEKESSDSSLNGNSSIPSSNVSSSESKQDSKEEAASSESAASSVEEVYDKTKLIENLALLNTGGEIRISEILSATGVFPTGQSMEFVFAEGVTTTVSVVGDYSIVIEGKNLSSAISMKTETAFKLSEILENGELSVDDLKDFGLTITEDDVANDTCHMAGFEQSFEGYYKYDEDNDQYISYSSANGGPVFGQYLLSDDGVPDLSELMEAFVYIADNGTYDKSKSAVLIDIADFEGPLDMISAETAWITSIGIKVDGYMPVGLLIEMDEETADYESAFSNFSIDLDDVSYEMEYDISFLELGSAKVAFPEAKDPACENHPFFGYAEIGDGHRKYCDYCYKFVSGVEDHEEDATYGVCKECGHHELSDKIYSENPVQQMADHVDFFEYSYRLDKDGRIFDFLVGDYVEGKDYEPNDKWTLSYERDIFELRDSTTIECFYYADAGVLITHRYNDDRALVFGDACYYVGSSTYWVYDITAMPEDDPNWFSNPSIAGDYIETATPRETFVSYSLTENHSYGTENKSVQVDACHGMDYGACPDCGKPLFYSVSTQHDFEYQLISAEELIEVVGEEVAGSYANANFTCMRAVCKVCDEEQYLCMPRASFNHPTLMSLFVNFVYVPEYGMWVDRYTGREMEHVLDEYGACGICGYYVLSIGGYSIGFDPDNPQNPYVVNANEEFVYAQNMGDDVYEGQVCRSMLLYIEETDLGYMLLIYGDDNHNTYSGVVFAFDNEEPVTIVFPEPIEITGYDIF